MKTFSKVGLNVFRSARIEAMTVNVIRQVLLAAVAFTLTAPLASATTYNFTFTGGGGMDATGTLSIVNGVVVSGSISVTGIQTESSYGPVETVSAAGSLAPTPPSGTYDIRDLDGDVVTYDNAVNMATDPSLDSDGLGFAFDPYPMGSTPPSGYDVVINLWGNSPGSYTLFVGEANPSDLNPNGTLIAGRDAQWVYSTNDGSLTITSALEPSTGALILCALIGLVAVRPRRVLLTLSET
jgi:hypothetical protein